MASDECDVPRLTIHHKFEPEPDARPQPRPAGLGFCDEAQARARVATSPPFAGQGADVCRLLDCPGGGYEPLQTLELTCVPGFVAKAGVVVYIWARSMTSALPETIGAVTFDCWSTLLHEAPRTREGGHRRSGTQQRVALLAQMLNRDEDQVAAAFAQAWRQHQRAWHERVVFASADMLEHTLATLDVPLSSSSRAQLLRELEEEILSRGVCAIAGARELLEQLRSRGIRTALICDTGFTPGRVVRQLLAQHGLLEVLQETIFSEEVGVPKPHPRAFLCALSALGVEPGASVHVGDLRRSDIAGARAVGMGSVRFRGHHDDHEQASGSGAGVIDCAAAGCVPACARPEADAVVDTYSQLGALLEPRLATHFAG